MENNLASKNKDSEECADSPVVNVDESEAYYNDFVSLMGKYSGEYVHSVTIAGDMPINDKGYYTLFIKRDNTLPEGDKIKVASMAKQMPLSDLIEIFSYIVNGIQSSKDNEHYA